MKHVQRILLILLLVTGVAGCTFDLPAPISASLDRFEKGVPIQSRRLTERQLLSLVTWLKQHHSGWFPSIVTYVPKIEVRVTHKNGNQSSINIWPQKIIVNSEGSQLVKSFESSELQRLLSSVGAYGN